MSLISEINRTETNKNKTKQVATNIDNKLVELGGKQAINLADVPNKIEGTIKENYKKIARGNLNDIKHTPSLDKEVTTRIHTNCDFKIDEAIVIVNAGDSNTYPAFPDLYVSSKVWFRNMKGRPYMHVDTYGYFYPIIEIEGSDILFITRANQGVQLTIKGWIAIE